MSTRISHTAAWMIAPRLGGPSDAAVAGLVQEFEISTNKLLETGIEKHNQ
jgi:hypothetical protein